MSKKERIELDINLSIFLTFEFWNNREYGDNDVCLLVRHEAQLDMVLLCCSEHLINSVASLHFFKNHLIFFLIALQKSNR